MDVDNTSGIATEYLTKLLDEVVAYCGFKPHVVIFSKTSRRGIDGEAIRGRVKFFSGRVIEEAHIVRIYVGRKEAYPVAYAYQPEAGTAYFEDFEAHLVHVLMHEFRHIAQYRGLVPLLVDDVEVDAERFALAYDDWRRCSRWAA